MQNLFLSPITRDELKLDISDIVKKEVETLLAKIQELKASNATKYLTRKETAKRLGISLPTLNDWTKTGKVVGYRIGSLIRYKEDELETSLAQIQTRRRAA